MTPLLQAGGYIPFARKILEQAQTFPWSIQGFGMFRLYLTGDIRLHVWNSNFRVPFVDDIHNHPWDFESVVLAGKITDSSYLFDSGHHGETQETQIKCGPGGGLLSKARVGRLQKVSTRLFFPQERYELPSYAIHSTAYEQGTVTLMQKTRTDPNPEHALVYHPKGKAWVSAEPRHATLDEVQEMAESALQRFDLDARIVRQP